MEVSPSVLLQHLSMVLLAWLLSSQGVWWRLESACHPRHFLQCLSTMQFMFGQHTLLWKQSGLCLHQQGHTSVSSTSSAEEGCHCEWCCIDCYNSRSYLYSLVAPSQGEAGIFVKQQRQWINFGPESRHAMHCVLVGHQTQELSLSWFLDLET